jgi:hypothetical protein
MNVYPIRSATGHLDQVRQDIAFLRAVVDDHDSTLGLDGAILTAVGSIFGCVSLFYWSVSVGIATVAGAWSAWAWIAGVAVLVPSVLVLQRRFPHSPGPASRAMSAAWQGVGTGITIATVAFALGAWRLQVPSMMLWAFPVVLFTLYGAAWTVAFAVRRRWAFALIAAGCYAAALGCGLLMGQPGEWLVLSLGLFLFVAIPGIVVVRQARAA